MPNVAMYAGSFDPITNGHADLIKRSLSFVDRLIVAVATNVTKQPLLGSPFAFSNRGQSGLEISELFPRLARHVLCLLGSAPCALIAGAEATNRS